MKNKKPFFTGLAVGLIVMFIFNFYFFGIRYGINILFSDGFSKEEYSKMEQKMDRIVTYLDQYYYEDVDKNKLIEGSYGGLVSQLGDPYTTYFDPKTFEEFSIDTEGSYAGIGVLVSIDEKDNSIVVVAPFEGAPGEQAGLLPQDKILSVDGEDVTGEELDQAVSMIKGPEGTTVTLSIYRKTEDRIFDVEVTRQQIDIPTVSHEMLEGDIGYIKIISFDRVTYDQFMEAYNDLNQQGQKGMIIDLRNNPGGLLDIVKEIADELLPEGLIVYTEDKEGNKETLTSDGQRQFNKPLAILVNGNSASASEILAGAVKDHGVGTLVGTTTFGKGLVQSIFDLKDGSAIKITVSKYYTPNGHYIHGQGIEPDEVVELPEELQNQLSLPRSEDIQLKRAIEVIQEKENQQ